MKMIKRIIIIGLLTFSISVYAQNVGINSTGATPNASAMLDVDAAPTNDKGFAMPRLTTLQRIAIVTPIDGLQVYDTNLKGFYYFNTTTNKWDCVSNPAGTIQYFANSTAPVGYLECNGQSANTAQYPELFNAIGYTYGGSGTSFNVPDLRGEFIRGWDNARGIDVGRSMGNAQTDAGRVVSGEFPSAENSSSYSLNGSFAAYTSYGTQCWSSQGCGAGTTGYVTMNSTNQWGPIHVANEFRPRNVALMPCIKY